MASRTVRSHRAAILAPDASQEMSKLKGTDTVLFFFFLKEYFRVGGMLSVITLLIVLTPDSNSQTMEICLYGIWQVFWRCLPWCNKYDLNNWKKYFFFFYPCSFRVCMFCFLISDLYVYLITLCQNWGLFFLLRNVATWLKISYLSVCSYCNETLISSRFIHFGPVWIVSHQPSPSYIFFFFCNLFSSHFSVWRVLWAKIKYIIILNCIYPWCN